ncbi:MAG: hypothetical protein GXO48_00375 [Chlorobi bacterium]|nr:hypothetical protein [Chlorobiota bacterium]
MGRKKFLLIATFLLMSIAWSAKATHIMGGVITYRWLGGNDYEITLVLFRDCEGIQLPTSATISISSASCGQNFSVTIPLRGSALEVSQVCPSQANLTTCHQGGALPGTQRGEYIDTVTLPPCPDWVFEYTTCCRNTPPGGLSVTCSSFYVYTTLDNSSGPNSSVEFSGSYMPYVCEGQPYCYFPGIINPDGDSLVIEFETAYGTSITDPCGYAPGFSPTNPIVSTTPITLDSVTGQICFTIPPGSGNMHYIITFKVTEYKNGQPVGVVHREIQVVSMQCPSNNLPVFSVPGGSSCPITDVTGGTQENCNTIIACTYTPVSFNVHVWDLDSLFQNIQLESNVADALPGATFNTSCPTGNCGYVVGNVSWTSSGPGKYYVTFSADDGECPIPGVTHYTVLVDVRVDTTMLVAFDGDTTEGFNLLVEGCTDGSLVFYTATNFNDSVLTDIVVNYSGGASPSDIYGPPPTTSWAELLLPGDTFKTYPLYPVQDNISEGPETLVVQTIGRCGVASEVEIVIMDKPESSVLFSDSTLCYSDYVTLIGEGNALHHIWATDTGFLCIECDTLTLFMDSSRFFYYINKSGLCEDTAITFMKVSHTRMDFEPETLQICLNDTIRVLVPEGIWVRHGWKTKTASEILCSTCDTTYIVGIEPGEALIEGIDTFGCRREDIIYLDVDTTAYAYIIASDTMILKGATVTLVAKTTSELFWWVLPRPKKDKVDSLVRVYVLNPTETLTVYLHAYSRLGCFRSDSIVIYAIDQPPCGDSTIWVPTAFSPNGDGVNDVLYLYGRTSVEIIEWGVLDRWGNLYYKDENTTIDLNLLHTPKGWNGIGPNGETLRPDVYAWYAIFKCDRDARKYVISGDVMLFR